MAIPILMETEVCQEMVSLEGATREDSEDHLLGTQVSMVLRLPIPGLRRMAVEVEEGIAEVEAEAEVEVGAEVGRQAVLLPATPHLDF